MSPIRKRSFNILYYSWETLISLSKNNLLAAENLIFLLFELLGQKTHECLSVCSFY